MPSGGSSSSSSAEWRQLGPRLTIDLDIVPAPSEPNVRLLGERLQALDAVVREPVNRRLPVTLDLLQTRLGTKRGGQLRIRTKRGPVDILWRLHDGRGYEELFGGSVVLSDDEREVRVIGIDDLVDVKKGAGRPKTCGTSSVSDSTTIGDDARRRSLPFQHSPGQTMRKVLALLRSLAAAKLGNAAFGVEQKL